VVNKTGDPLVTRQGKSPFLTLCGKGRKKRAFARRNRGLKERRKKKNKFRRRCIGKESQPRQIKVEERQFKFKVRRGGWV